MKIVHLRLLLIIVALAMAGSVASGVRAERITDRKKGETTATKIARFPLRLATFPLWLLDRALYYGILDVEQNNRIPRSIAFRQRLAARGIVPTIGGAGDGAGFGAGIAWRISDGAVKPTLSVAGSLKGYQDHSFELDWSELTAADLDIVTDVRYRSRPEEDFFGIGRTSREENRTSYDLETTSAGITVIAHPSKVLGIDARIGYSRNNVFGGKDERFPTAQETFSSAETPGIDGGAKLATGDLGVTLDYRDHPGDPTRGGLLRVAVGLDEDLEGAVFDSWRYSAELQGYLPLLGRGNRFGPRSWLAVRVRGDFNESRGNGVVPFFRLPQLGGSATLRGYREFRFRDRHALIGNLEYRWRIQSILQAVLFLDEGMVFNDFDEVDADNFRASYGGGVRVAFANATFFRFEVGHGAEGTRFFTKFALAF